MRIYGIYDTKYKEQCIFIGTLYELKRYTKLTGRGIDRILRTGKYQGNEVAYVYDE